MATEKPKQHKSKVGKKKTKGSSSLEDEGDVKELSLPYGQFIASQGKTASPFLKGTVKSTPHSTMDRLSNLEKNNVESMRKMSIEHKEQKSLLQSERQRVLQEDLGILANGTFLLKVGHRGPAKKTKFYVQSVDDQWVVRWDSKSKSANESTFLLKECLCALGQGQGLFKERSNIKALKSKDDGHSRLSFTLMFQERTVDVMAEKQEDFDRWCRVLRFVGVILDTHSGYT